MTLMSSARCECCCLVRLVMLSLPVLQLVLGQLAFLWVRTWCCDSTTMV